MVEKKKEKEIVNATVSKDLADAIAKVKKDDESFSDALDRVFFTLIQKVQATDSVSDDEKVSDIAESIKEKYMLAGNLISLKQLEKALQESLGIDNSALDDDKIFKRLERLIMIKAMANMFNTEQKREDTDTKIALAKLEAKLEAILDTQKKEKTIDRDTDILQYIDSKFTQLISEIKSTKQSTGDIGIEKLKEAKRTIEEYAQVMKDLGVKGEDAEKWKEEAIGKLLETIGKVGGNIVETIQKQQIPPPPSIQATAQIPPPQIPAEVLAHLNNSIPFMLTDGSIVIPVANKNVMNAIEQFVEQGIKQEIAGHKVIIFSGEVAKKVEDIIRGL